MVNLFNAEEQRKIISAIQDAEKNTSGEIRIHLENKYKGDILESAKKVFQKLGMTKTKLRNGVLIFIGVSDHTFCVLGDQGIDEKVPAGFWDKIVQEMESNFKRGEFALGTVKAIHAIGKELKAYFPLISGDKNELSNEISGF